MGAAENFGYWVGSLVGSLLGRGWLRLDARNGFSVDCLFGRGFGVAVLGWRSFFQISRRSFDASCRGCHGSLFFVV